MCVRCMLDKGKERMHQKRMKSGDRIVAPKEGEMEGGPYENAVLGGPCQMLLLLHLERRRGVLF